MLRALAFGGGTFVAVGDSGIALTSSNALAWTSASTGITNSLFGVANGNGIFVAVGSAGIILTSADGVNWAPQSSGTIKQLTAVAWTPVGFVAVGRGATILASPDGTNWAAQTAATSADFIGVGSGFGQVYIGADANPPAFFWSTNGSNWQYLNLAIYLQPDLFNGNFVAGNGTVLGVQIRGQFLRSTNGATWTSAMNNAGMVYCFGLAFARGQFVTVGGNFQSPGRTIGTSTNGLKWQVRYNKTSENRLLGVAYGAHRFVAVGDGGGILVSDPLLWFTRPAAISGELHATLNAEPGTPYHILVATNLSQTVWNDLGSVTNTDEADDIILPFSQNNPGAFYRVATP